MTNSHQASGVAELDHGDDGERDADGADDVSDLSGIVHGGRVSGL
jgi:hypothetical protein